MDLGPLIVAIVGSFLMGFVVMWICFFILNRIQTFDAAAFGEIIVAMFGGTILTIYSTTISDVQWVFWIYPMGLVGGMLGYHFLAGGNVKLGAEGFTPLFRSLKQVKPVPVPAGTSLVKVLTAELQARDEELERLREKQKKT
jgi:hypothetical protein